MAVHSDGRDTAIGAVRRATSRTLHVWFGGWGWGQRVWAFSARDGAPSADTAAHQPTARLDLAWRSPFSGDGETDPAWPEPASPYIGWDDETRDCLSLAVHGRTRDKAATCEGFVRENVARGALVRTDGWQGYDGLTVGGWRHDGIAVNADHSITEAHLPMLHIVFSNLKAWILGTHHGVSQQHLQAYLSEYTFRFNRRFYPMTAFNSLLGLGVKTIPPTYASLYSGVWEHPGGQPKSPQIEMPFA
jgi:transposase-like protein